MKKISPEDDFVNAVLGVMSDCLSKAKDAWRTETERAEWRERGLSLSIAINQFELARRSK